MRQLVKESLNENYYEALTPKEEIEGYDYIDNDIATTDIIIPTLNKCKELMSPGAFKIFMTSLKEIIQDYE